MKHLIFVVFALGIFSGTLISAKAQTAVNSQDGKAVKGSLLFIDGIEIKPEPIDVGWQIFAKPQVKNTGTVTASSGKRSSVIEQCTSLQFKYAQLLNMDVEAVTHIDLYIFIEKWWATPYRYGGATKDGIDCSAYTGTLVHDVYGAVLSRTSGSQYQECQKINKETLRVGDLVFFKTRRKVSHVGVYLGNGYFTHASTTNGVMISSLDDPYYFKKYAGGGRIKTTAKTAE